MSKKTKSEIIIELNDSLDAKNKDIKQLTDVIDGKDNEYYTLTERFDALDGNFNLLAADKARLTNRLDTCIKGMDVANNKIIKLEDTVSGLTNDNALLMADNETLKHEAEDNDAKTSKLKAEIEILTDANNFLDKECKANSATIKRMTTELDYHCTNNNNKVKELEEVRTERDMIKRSKTKLEIVMVISIVAILGLVLLLG